jgi:iron only hydrogenase large subunit-like protein
VIVANGFSEIRKLIPSILSGKTKAHYVEIMACPGGCINGGGQPLLGNKDVKARAKAIYDIDESETLKWAHNNPMIDELYNNYLNKPGSELALKMLHVSYSKRDVLL